MSNSVEHSVICILNFFQILAFFKQTMQNLLYTGGINQYQKMYLQKVP